MSLARPGLKQATFPAFCGTWRFITTLTTVHHLSQPEPNHSIPLPITLLTGAACFLPGLDKDLSATRYVTLHYLSHDRFNWSCPTFPSTTFQNLQGISVCSSSCKLYCLVFPVNTQSQRISKKSVFKISLFHFERESVLFVLGATAPSGPGPTSWGF